MEIEFEGSKLRVHENGTIERWLYGKWKTVKGTNQNGYLRISFNDKYYYIHRIIGMVFLGLNITNTKEQIDHINRNKSDNRLENLRIVSQRENEWNKEHKGYCFKHNGWEAYITINGKQISKRFKTEQEAIQWRNEQKIIYHTILR